MTIPKFTLSKRGDGKLALEKDDGERATALFATKAEFLKGGVLAAAVGKEGGSVKIQRVDGRYQQERTYPRSADPRGSKG